MIIIGLTLAGAIIYEILRRREARIAAQRLVDGLDTGKPVQKAGFGALPQMAGIMILLVVVAGVATTVVASGYNAEACKAEIMQEKLRIQEKFAEEQRQLREERMKTAAE